jgi:dolichyl-phosphate beta-glucosyltransferase
LTEKIIMVVPCYNEADRLDCDSFIQALGQDPGLHWLFVNDGSKDNTQALIEQMAAKEPARVFCHSLNVNSGKGEAVRQGLLRAIELNANIIGYYDADQATPLTEIFRLLQILHVRQSQVLLGSRVFLLGRDLKRQRWRYLLGRAFAFVASRMLKLSVYDTQCGMKLIRVFPKLKDCLEEPFVSSWLFDVELIQRLVQKAGLKSQDFFEEPLLQWTEIGGSKVKAQAFLTALIDLFKIKLKSVKAQR